MRTAKSGRSPPVKICSNINTVRLNFFFNCQNEMQEVTETVTTSAPHKEVVRSAMLDRLEEGRPW